MSNRTEIDEAVHGRDDRADLLTKEEMATIQECRDGNVKGMRFKNAYEATRWLNEEARAHAGHA